MEPTSIIMRLPNELLFYMLKHFVGLADLWQLMQVSRDMRSFALDTIHKRWKIEVSPCPDTTMKVQCRAALIALENLSIQLSPQTAVYTQFPCSSNPTTTTATTTANHHTSSSSSSSVGDLSNQRRPTSAEPPNPNFMSLPVIASTYEPSEEENELLLAATATQLITTMNSLNGTLENKLLKDLMEREGRLHQRIVQGISSYRHKYVLIEDIDIRNRIRTAVDVIFHHAVFVSASSRPLHGHNPANKALAAMIVRLLTRLDAAFPSYCREIAYTLADNIKAFLEYTGYKLLAMQPRQGGYLPTLEQTLHSISACFDLMGAAFIGKVLSESHVECAVQRACELLAEGRLRTFKRELLVGLLDGLLTIKPNLVAGDLCRLVRVEIEKCDRHHYHTPRTLRPALVPRSASLIPPS